MSLAGAIAFDCNAVQGKLDAYFANDLIPYKKVKDNALIKFLKSPANRAGIKQIQEDTTNAYGQKLKVKMQTRDPLCLLTVKQNWTCDQAIQLMQVAPKEHLFELDDTPYTLKDPTDVTGKPLVFKWNFNDWKKLCINQPAFFEETIAMALAQLEEKVNKDLLTVLATKLGKQMTPAGAAVVDREIPLFTSSTMSALPVQNPFVALEIQKTYNLAKTTARYNIFGGTQYWSYNASKGFATASEWGYDAKMGSPNAPFWYDLDFDAALGADTFITIPNGAVQLVQWNQNVGDGFIDHPQSKKFTVTTPSGLKVDMFWEHFTQNQCNEIRVGMMTYAELVAVPGGGCGLDNAVNGIFKFKDCSVTTSLTC